MERMVATNKVTQGSHKQQEELIINERNQHSTIEEKRSEEIAATTTGEIAATCTYNNRVDTNSRHDRAHIRAHTTWGNHQSGHTA